MARSCPVHGLKTHLVYMIWEVTQVLGCHRRTVSHWIKDKRKKVEMLFAHLKRILNLAQLRLRGPNGAKDKFLLAATAQNLRKLAKLRSQCALQATTI